MIEDLLGMLAVLALVLYIRYKVLHKDKSHQG